MTWDGGVCTTPIIRYEGGCHVGAECLTEGIGDRIESWDTMGGPTFVERDEKRTPAAA